MQPLISVIIPVHNGEAYLANCIESVAAQTYEPLEILVINDGSTDGTVSVCEKCEKIYENFHFITTQDIGVSASRNCGIAMAKGELITFVDADDRIHPQMLQRLYDVMTETGSEIAGCDFHIWKTEREWEIAANSVPANECHTKIYQKQSYLTEQILNGNSRCWSKLYRSSLLTRMQEQMGTCFMEGLTIGEDMLFILNLLQEVSCITETNFKGYGYYKNPNGAMNRSFCPEYMDQIRCWELARAQIQKLSPESEHKVTSLLLISTMLTVGKLAALSGKMRNENRMYVKQCYEKIWKEKKDKKAMKMLTKGYRLKVRFFALAPELYLWCYHYLRH